MYASDVLFKKRHLGTLMCAFKNWVTDIHFSWTVLMKPGTAQETSEGTHITARWAKCSIVLPGLPSNIIVLSVFAYFSCFWASATTCISCMKADIKSTSVCQFLSQIKNVKELLNFIFALCTTKQVNQPAFLFWSAHMVSCGIYEKWKCHDI